MLVGSWPTRRVPGPAFSVSIDNPASCLKACAGLTGQGVGVSVWAVGFSGFVVGHLGVSFRVDFVYTQGYCVYTRIDLEGVAQ